jgi:hypothetical protein
MNLGLVDRSMFDVYRGFNPCYYPLGEYFKQQVSSLSQPVSINAFLPRSHGISGASEVGNWSRPDSERRQHLPHFLRTRHGKSSCIFRDR